MRCVYEHQWMICKHASQWKSILVPFLWSNLNDRVKLIFSVWKYIVCCLWCAHNRSLDNRKKRVAICCFKFLLVLSMKYTALFSLLFFCRLRIDIFITIFAYLSHLARPYLFQKRLFSLFNERHTCIHKCVMNIIRNLHILRIKHTIFNREFSSHMDRASRLCMWASRCSTCIYSK